MESPVRILLGASSVVILLLVSSTTVYGIAIPRGTTAASVGDEQLTLKNLPNTPDVSLNELNSKIKPKVSTSEENAKYKDRGRGNVKFLSSSKTSTETSFRRARSTVAPQLVIVTPAQEIKKPAEIVDSMKHYKKTRMLHITSSTTPLPIVKDEQSEEEFEKEYEDEEEASPEKVTSSFDNFFSIPSFGDFSHDSHFDNSNKKNKHDFDSITYGGFSSLFPHRSAYGYTEPNHNSFKAEFFNFDVDLTTPKHDYFDKKFRQVSASIIKNLDTIKTKTGPSNLTNVQKIIKENLGLGSVGNNSIPGNKSTVFFKNTKEIRLLDNDGAGSANNKGLSDVHGTSIYYEMSVLSTETYAINNSDYDCDNDTLSSGPTASTSVEEELASISVTEQPVSTQSIHIDLSTETLSTVPSTYTSVPSTASSTYFPESSASPVYNTIIPLTISTQNSVPSTEKAKSYLTNYRNRSYSKRLNLNGNKDSLNSVTSKPVNNSSTSSPRQTSKYQFSKLKTTPKNKRVWMWPRRGNTTSISSISSRNSTKMVNTTTRPRLTSPFFPRPVKSVLTTVSSDIDPILQSDISGLKKVVHSASISDNTVSSLSKRGSTKFGTPTATSAEVDAESAIPPTAWALASYRVPPSPSSAPNKTESPMKSVDENELQNVNDFSDKTKVTTTSTSPNPNINDVIPKTASDILQKKMPRQPITTTSSGIEPKTQTHTEIKSDNLSNESNLSSQNSVEEFSTTDVTKELFEVTQTSWTPVVQQDEITERNDEEKGTVPLFDTTKSTDFLPYILPTEITTLDDESAASSEVNQTVYDVDSKIKPVYEITTIRFSYVPNTEVVTTSAPEADTTETIVPSTWHPAFPTRNRITILEDTPITTYRPQYTTTEKQDEVTTTFIEVTSPIEVSSQILGNITKMTDETTETPMETTSVPTETPANIDVTTQMETEEITTPPPTAEITTQSATTERITTITTQATTTPEPSFITSTDTIEDTTSIVIEVQTEINTEKERLIKPTTSTRQTTESSPKDQKDTDENSSSNELTPETIKTTSFGTPIVTVTTIPVTVKTTTEMRRTEPPTTTEEIEETTTQRSADIQDTTLPETTTDRQYTPKPDNHDATRYTGDMTTSSSRVFETEEAGSGAAIAITVSTIGVVALVLLIALLLVVRRRGRRGVYAQRCTPVSLDAYSLDSVSVGHRKGNHRLRASKRSYGNPAYDDEVTSHPMQYAALANFALDIESMTAEFAEIPSVSVKPDEVPPGCEDKNRYSNVLPLPETRVPLKRIGNDPTTEYINANFITGPGSIKNYYIACQAPLSNTVVDFWRMIWEQNSRLVVMLTEYMENGVEKCYEYLPPSEISDNKRIFGEFKIILKKREQRDKYAISSVQLINLSTRTWREVTHLWYFWPAKGVPDDYDSVIDFLCEMRSYMKISQAAKEYDEEGVEVIYGDQSRTSFSTLSRLRSDEPISGNGANMYSPSKAEEQLRRVTSNNGTLGRMKAASEVEGMKLKAEGIRPCVVVCASGAGRSAALLALDLSARALPGAADVPRVVRQLRAQRPHSLSNRHHYIFVYKVLSEYGNKMLGGGVDTI